MHFEEKSVEILKERLIVDPYFQKTKNIYPKIFGTFPILTIGVKSLPKPSAKRKLARHGYGKNHA